MPLNLWIYSRFITDDPKFGAGTIPYLDLVLVLVSIAIPVAVGMLFAAKLPRKTATVMRFAKPVVLCLLLIFIACGL